MIWHVWAQLSLAGDKLWMVNADLCISEYVIDKVGQSVGGFGSHHSDAENKRAVHDKRKIIWIQDLTNFLQLSFHKYFLM